MTSNFQEIKDQLNKQTEQFEKHLEPWQRGLLLISLTSLLLISVYYLTKKESPQPKELSEIEKKQIEQLAEEKILKKMDFLKRLQE